MEVESSALDAALGREEGEHKFNLLVKYIVRPSIAKEFIGEFLKVCSRFRCVKCGYLHSTAVHTVIRVITSLLQRGFVEIMPRCVLFSRSRRRLRAWRAATCTPCPSTCRRTSSTGTTSVRLPSLLSVCQPCAVQLFVCN